MPKKKKGRKPKGWKPDYCIHLQVKKGEFIIIFDKDIEGDLRDFMYPYYVK